MAKVSSTMHMQIKEVAPDFTLPSTNGFGVVSIANYTDKKGYLIAFICNHCPYVKYIADTFSSLANAYQKKGIAVFAINSNNYITHPEDSPEMMTIEAKERGYEFPYLIDESQQVAKDFHAACTPDFFLLDGNKALFYRGQFDSSRPSLEIPISGEYLQTAMDALLAGKPAPAEQIPSIGCNIKWK